MGVRLRVFADVVTLLVALSSSYMSAIITDGAPDIHRGKIAGAGLGAHIDAVVVWVIAARASLIPFLSQSRPPRSRRPQGQTSPTCYRYFVDFGETDLAT